MSDAYCNWSNFLSPLTVYAHIIIILLINQISWGDTCCFGGYPPSLYIHKYFQNKQKKAHHYMGAQKWFSLSILRKSVGMQRWWPLPIIIIEPKKKFPQLWEVYTTDNNSYVGAQNEWKRSGWIFLIFAFNFEKNARMQHWRPLPTTEPIDARCNDDDLYQHWTATVSMLCPTTSTWGSPLTCPAYPDELGQGSESCTLCK